MKISKILAILSILLIATISCKDDDDNNASETFSEDQAAGNYRVTEYRSEDGRGTANGIRFDFVLTGQDYNMTVAFTQNPNTVMADGTLNVMSTITFMGETQNDITPLSAEEFGLNGSWDISGEQMTFVQADGQRLRANILLLTDTVLRLAVDLSDVSSDVFLGAQAEGTLFIGLTRI